MEEERVWGQGAMHVKVGKDLAHLRLGGKLAVSKGCALCK